MKHLRKEEGKLREHEWEGEDHAEIDNEERSHEPDHARNAQFLRLLSFCPAPGLLQPGLDPDVFWQGFWHQEDGQQRSRQSDPSREQEGTGKTQGLREQASEARTQCEPNCLCRREITYPAPLFRKRDRIAHHRHRDRYQARKQHALNKAYGNEQQRDIDERQQQVGDDKPGQRDEEDGFATNAARPYSHWRTEEEHPQTKGPFHQRQRLGSQPQGLQALREDGNDHGKSGHHQGDAADQERQSGGDRSRFRRGSRHGSCSHHLLQGDGDGIMIEEACSHLFHPFLLAYITCNLQVFIYIYLLPDLPQTGNQQKSEPNGEIRHTAFRCFFDEKIRRTIQTRKRRRCLSFSSRAILSGDWGIRGETPNEGRRRAMPRSSLYALLWSEEYQQYEVHLRGQLHQRFPPGESEAFSRWLSEQTSFAFAGQAGWLSVIKEARSAGAGYWYAYRTQDRHTHKRYLGPTAKVTFARLEEAASGFTPTNASNEQARSTASQQQKTFLS